MSEPDRVTAHAEITTHVADGLSLLTREFQKDRIEAILSPWLSQVQHLEAALFDLLSDGLATAVGAQLEPAAGAGLFGAAREVAAQLAVAGGLGFDHLAVKRVAQGGVVVDASGLVGREREGAAQFDVGVGAWHCSLRVVEPPAVLPDHPANSVTGAGAGGVDR